MAKSLMAPVPASQDISGIVDILMTILKAVDRSSVALMHCSRCVHLGITVKATESMLSKVVVNQGSSCSGSCA